MGFVANYACNLAALALGREPIRPLIVSYYVTHRCGLQCTYCSDGAGRPFRVDPAAELNTREARRLIGLLARAADTLDVTGGEPLVREDLEELLAFAREQGMRTVLNTKGIGLAERPDIMKHCDVLVISLDATDPKALAAVIGDGEGEARRVREAAEYAIERAASSDTRVILSAVAMPGYLGETRKVLDFAMSHAVGFQLSPCIDGTSIREGLKANPEWRGLVDEMLARKRAGGAVFGTPDYLAGIRDVAPFRCHPLLMPTIRPDGRLYYPCLESGRAARSVIEEGSYDAALKASGDGRDVPRCRDKCHIFCHMGLSLLQRHPLAALGELRLWRSRPC